MIFKKDYTGNLVATDRNWFYLNDDHSSRSGGGGVFPDLEYDAGRWWQIPHVLVKRNDDFNLSITFRLLAGPPISTQFTLHELKYEVGASHVST